MRLLGTGRDASAGRHRAAVVALPGRRRNRQAEGQLLRDDQDAGGRAWSAQEADRRPWPVRRRGDRGARRSPRGEGFAFQDKITGGVVPRQYIPSVETGVRDAIRRGPLGFPVVDLAVTLTDGSYHTVEFLRCGVPGGGAARARRGSAEGQARAARAGAVGRDRDPVGGSVEGDRPRHRPARPDPRLRFPAGLVGLGRAQRHDPGIGDRRPHRRTALGHRGRRHLLDPLRPHGGTERPAGRPRASGTGEGCGTVRTPTSPIRGVGSTAPSTKAVVRNAKRTWRRSSLRCAPKNTSRSSEQAEEA